MIFKRTNNGAGSIVAVPTFERIAIMEFTSKYGMDDWLEDGITGFAGIVVAVEFLPQGIRYGLLTRALSPNGIPQETQWFYEGRLKHVNMKKIGF